MKCVMCGYNNEAVVLNAWAFYVPQGLPTQNDITKVNRFEYKRTRDIWHKYLLAIKMGARIPDAYDKRRVTVYRAMGYRRSAYDRVNFMGGCKPVIDAMVKVAMLIDDSAAHMEDHYPLQIRAADMTQHEWDHIVGLPIYWIAGYDKHVGGAIIKLEVLTHVKAVANT